ncbi:hypothetical protein [Streptomyces noursei]|uniref:hypothetical protein n=1 Tax=Streptomyces noursei TaxID=1971 RepID=UPI00167A35B5|nr:hypothetical protein [Streptomyces noursei]MCZ1020211.1 hypothetical protein [Streptomyces noursei]GGX39675.1 hypothetical protein GCM10010341_71910 [Streptomyces noursei]
MSRTVRTRPGARGGRRATVLLALVWLTLSVIAHHDLPDTCTPMAAMQSASSTQPMAAVRSVPSARLVPSVHPAPSVRPLAAPHRAGPDHGQPRHARTDRARSGEAQSGHGHDGGAHCSSYDVRAEQLVPPPPLVGQVRAPGPMSSCRSGAGPARGPAPPDPASLSVLRI